MLKRVILNKKKRTTFNNTTKISNHYMNIPSEIKLETLQVIQNISINNRSGAKCHMLSKISTPKANAISRRYNGFENKSTLISPPSSTKHSEIRGPFFNFPGTTKGKRKGMNTSELATGHVVDKDKNFKNMSGPIQFDKSHSGWQHNFSGLSHNSSSSKIGPKEIKQNKGSSSNPRGSQKYTEDANREIMKKITSDNKYFRILKKITQDSGRQYSYTRTINAEQQNSKEEGKEYDVDVSELVPDNLLESTTTNKSNYRMYGTEKIDMKKYNNLISQAPIMIDGEEDENVQDGIDTFSEPKMEFPIQPGRALKLFMNKLSDYEKAEILDYKHIYHLGLGSEKIQGSPSNEFNYGYDDERGDYIVNIGDHIAYRFEIIDFLGKGSFGQALKCYDHKRKTYIALKIIRNKKKFQYQASVEVKILRHLRENDPNDENNIIRLKDSFIFRKHICITFELLSINLYEFIKSNDFQGVSLGLIRRFAIQILQGLRYSRQQSIIH